MKLFEVFTNQPFSDYYKNIVIANSKEEAKKLVLDGLPETFVIDACKELDGTPRIIYHDHVYY